MVRLLLLAVCLAGCRAPLDATDASHGPAACTVSGIPLLDIARAWEQADLVVTARTLRVLPASRFVQSPPPATGDTVRFLVTAEVVTAYGPSAPGERVDYYFTGPYAPNWKKKWTEGSEWTAWLALREARVPWAAVRAPIPTTSEMDSLIATSSIWPPAGLRFTPDTAVETVLGGRAEAEGYVFTFKTEGGTPARLRLTGLDAPTPTVWALPGGAEAWKRVAPCSLAGSRLHLALPSTEALSLEAGEAEAFTLLQGALGPARTP